MDRREDLDWAIREPKSLEEDLSVVSIEVENRPGLLLKGRVREGSPVDSFFGCWNSGW